MTAIFTNSPKLSTAVEIINNLEQDKFPKITSRIAESLHDRTKTAFSSEEKHKLTSVLKLDESNLQLVLNTIEFVLQQAAYHALKPVVLKAHLTQLKISDEKSDVLCLAWQSFGKEIDNGFRNQSIAPKQLEDISWDLNLKLSQTSKSKLKEPNAVFQLGIKDQDCNKKENLLVEFNHEQLLNLYNKLEMIQSQMDSLS